MMITARRKGGSVDPDKRKALSQFYREEFLRYLEHLQANGILGSGEGKAAAGVCRKFLSDLDHVCWRDHFPAVAETLLQNFDTLTRLSAIDPRQRH
jgi:hypothetical protein